MRSSFVLGVIAFLAIGSTVMAQRSGSLEPGSEAPGLDIDQWVKGAETEIKPGRVYVVEFWATWCIPCRKSIPHLSELQRQYGDSGLTIIGISTEEVDEVRPFVERQGDGMAYTVAVDRRSSTKRAYMDSAGRNSIPSAFIVDRQKKIAWIGNPLDEDFDGVLAKVMANRYNPKLEKEAAPIIAAARSARDVRNWRMAIKHYDQVIALDPRVFEDVAIERFRMMLLDMDDVEGAYGFAQTRLVGGETADDPASLSRIARLLATDPRIPDEKRNLDLALAAANKARELAGDDDPETLSTVALVRYHRGEVEEAVTLQKRAYFMAKPKHKSEYRRVLTSYMEAAGRRASSR